MTGRRDVQEKRRRARRRRTRGYPGGPRHVAYWRALGDVFAAHFDPILDQIIMRTTSTDALGEWP